jgi:hypothetical protein
MRTSRGFEEPLASFNARSVEYLVVGAHAFAFHGKPRFTKDLDLLIRRSPENAQRVLSALDAFGFGSLGLTEEDFLDPSPKSLALSSTGEGVRLLQGGTG